MRGGWKRARANRPGRGQAEIKVKMGAMSMAFTGTVEVIEQDPADIAR